MPRSVCLRSTCVLTTIAWLAVGCGTSAASAPANAPVAPLAAAAAPEAPPHTFTPRPHPARNRPAPPEPNLAVLPALVDRSATCFGWEVKEERRPTTKKPRRPRKPGSKKPPGFVKYGGGSKGDAGGSSGKKKKRRRKQAVSSGRAGGSPSGVIGGVVGGTLGGVAGGAARPAPPAEATPRPKPRPDPSPQPEPEPRASVAAEEADAGAPAPTQPSTDDAVVIATDNDDGYHDWGSSIYLSNDDTMSLSSAQRVIFAIDNFLPLPAEHIRPHELLNYFSFDTVEVPVSDDFSVAASIGADPDEEGIYSLAMAVRGRPLGLDERRNANLSIVVDRSGSMASDGRMEYLKRGLARMTGQLKHGDLVHLVVFDHSVCTPLQNFVVGRDDPRVLDRAIAALQPRGSTNLHDGLRAGYDAADSAYQGEYTNRVVMVTDAIANTGITDASLISTVSNFYDKRRIRLSGVGVGRDFNDDLLDKLTEEGKGAYVFLGSPAEVDAVFGPRFVSLIETTALDVHFQLHLPPSLRMNTFYGEESSTVKEDVQAIHYFANTSQLFLSDLMAKNGTLRPQDSVMLTVEYEDPETGEDMVEEYAFNLGEISESDRNVRKGRLVMHFVDGLTWMASRKTGAGRAASSWEDEEAWDTCERGREDLQQMAKGLQDDPEVTRVLGLWDQYCARYARPRRPHKRPPPDQWPSASG